MTDLTIPDFVSIEHDLVKTHFSVQVELPGAQAWLTPEEARAVARRLLDIADEAENERRAVVQVIFRHHSNAQRYSYFDPSGKLRVGDLALTDLGATVEVVAIGRGDYEGPLKALTAKVIPL